jgi:hypothetical protein
LVFGPRFIWGTSVTSTLAFEIVGSEPSQLKLVDTYDNGGYDWSYHGAYSFVSSQGYYFSSSQQGFKVFDIATPATTTPRIMKRGEFFLGGSSSAEGVKEVVVGVLPLYPASGPSASTTSFNTQQRSSGSSSLPVKGGGEENKGEGGEKGGVVEDEEEGGSSVRTCASGSGPVGGYIAVATSMGRVAVVAHLPGPFGDDFHLAATLTLPRSKSSSSDSSGSDSSGTDKEARHKHEYEDGFVSNSFAVDASGGIYVVSAEAMHKVQWTPPPPPQQQPVAKGAAAAGSGRSSSSASGASSFKDGTLEHSWSTLYSSSSSSRGHGNNHDDDLPLWPGRLGRGSGSSPSLMMSDSSSSHTATATNAAANSLPAFAVVTDGASPMRLLVFRTSDGSCVGNETVTFGQTSSSEKKNEKEEAAAKDGRSSSSSSGGVDSQSEQSVVVGGGRAVVVQNWIPPERVPRVCAALLGSSSSSSSSSSDSTSRPSFLATLVPGKVKHACSFLLGAFPLPGVEQFVIDQQTGKVTGTAWVNKEVQCASSIPAASLPLPPSPTSTASSSASSSSSTRPPPAYFYCLGMRETPIPPLDAADASFSFGSHLKRLLAFAGLLPRHEFVVEALHWSNGTRAWPAFSVGAGALFNPSYAAVQIGAHRDLVMGTAAGVLRVTSSSASSSASSTSQVVGGVRWEKSSAPGLSRFSSSAFAFHLTSSFGVGGVVVVVIIVLLVLLAMLLLSAGLAVVLVTKCWGLRSRNPRTAGHNEAVGGEADDDLLGLPPSNVTTAAAAATAVLLSPAASQGSSSSSSFSSLKKKQASATAASKRETAGSPPALTALKDSLREEQEARAAARVASGGSGGKKRGSTEEAPPRAAATTGRSKRPKLSLAFE